MDPRQHILGQVECREELVQVVAVLITAEQQSIGVPDNELFGVVADLQGLKRCDRHLRYGSYIVVRLTSDVDLRIHGLLLSPRCWLTP